MSEDCVFCRIVAGEEDAYVVYEDETTMAFLDINAVADGHTLVVPRDHHPGLTDMDADAAADLFVTVREVAAAIEEAVGPDGLNAIHSSGRAAGQDVLHAHVHVLPRYEDDGFEFAPARFRITEEEGRRVAARIREAL